MSFYIIIIIIIIKSFVLKADFVLHTLFCHQLFTAHTDTRHCCIHSLSLSFSGFCFTEQGSILTLHHPEWLITVSAVVAESSCTSTGL